MNALFLGTPANVRALPSMPGGAVGTTATGGMTPQAALVRSPQIQQSIIDADAAEAALIARYRARVDAGRRLARRVQSGEPLFLAVLATALTMMLFMPAIAVALAGAGQ